MGLTINTVCHEIRSLTNKVIFSQNIKRHKLNWDLIWAAMDTIEDTELAISSFTVKTEADTDNDDQGAEYLRVYGLFQAIFMQQDAVRNLAEGLALPRIDISTDPKANDVREIRNKYFGHHKYKRNGKTTYHGISRMTVGSPTITAWTYPNFSTEDINLGDAISTNKEYVKKSLQEILENMKKKKAEYTSTIKTKLSEDRQSYAFEKLYSWIYGNSPDRSAMTGTSLKILRQAIDDLEIGLKERYENLFGIGDTERTIEKSRYALGVLDELFASNPNGMNGDFNAEIYADSLNASFDDLINVSIEINAEFS